MFFSLFMCSVQAKDGIELEVLQSYCWMYSTLTIPRQYRGQCAAGDQDPETHNIVYNSYYQVTPCSLG